MMAFIPEAQTLLIVVASVESGKPNIIQKHSQLPHSNTPMLQAEVGISIYDAFPMITKQLLNLKN